MSGPLDDESHAAALAGLPGMTPVRLAKLLDGFQPTLAWKAVRAGTHPADPKRRFTAPARVTDVGGIGAHYARESVKILLPDRDGYPTMLIGDPGAPAVLFALGDPRVLEARPRVAIVGTRSASHYGRQVASELAADLAGEGVAVVSGLARGIDGAAHAGVVRGGQGGSAPPVAVVGTGLDVVYPSSNRELWGQVAALGTVLSESALGTKPHPGVFPARNRIIAGLSDVVVVVESHYNGGSLSTADAAARRSIPVCAVPGSVKSRASDGTNALLVDGCTPVRDATDVLVAISLARAGLDERLRRSRLATDGDAPPEGDRPSGVHQTRSSRCSGSDLPTTTPAVSGMRTARPHGNESTVAQSMTAEHRLVWDAVDVTPTTFETILIRTDLSIASVAEACDHLVESGALITGAGWWLRSPT